MRRRTFIAGVGSLAGIGSLLFGTGAFSGIEADRRLRVDLADDNDAFLSLQQLGDGKRSIEDDTPEKVEFSFPGLQERLSDPELGLGVDSVYEFDRDADESGSDGSSEGLLRIENQGTQSVEVYSVHETDAELVVELYAVTDPGKSALRGDPVKLTVGEALDVGFRIRTFGADVGTFDETLMIVAEAPN